MPTGKKVLENFFEHDLGADEREKSSAARAAA
jgi:hypothetical protein